MENLVCNISGKVRRELMYGGEFIVAPLKMIKPQVLNGSKGPIFYQEDGIEESEDAWNHMPITNGHPSESSARTPEFLKENYLGIVLNAKYNKEDKVLEAEGWFSVDRLKASSASLLKSLETGKPVELSTGLGFKGRALNEEQTFEEQSYSIVAESITPDHLAILVDSPGACSTKQGCGVNNQSDELEFEIEPEGTQSIEQENTTFIFNFNKQEGNNTAMKREDIIQALVANCGDCTEEDAKGFEALSDTALEKTYNSVVGNAKKEEAEVKNEDDEPEVLEPTEAQIYADTLLNEKKQEIVSKLVANIKDETARNAKAEQLIQKPLGELRETLELIPEPVKEESHTFNYSGQGQYRESVGNAEAEEALATPSWAAEDYRLED